LKITITKKEANWDFVTEQNESLLYAALRQGLNLNYECATGTCGSCKAKLVKGDLDPGWEQAPGRSYLKSNRGEFLMCQSRALSDCEIRVPGNITTSAELANLPGHRHGTIKNLRTLTDDVMRFDVELDSPMRWQAGQFVVLSTAAVDGFRAYSMINFVDKGSDLLEFVVKRLPNGRFSDWLFDDVTSPSDLSVFGPLGTAVFEPALNKDIMCIAGGSGIAGMMSILAHGCDAAYFTHRRAQLFFGVRAQKDIFFFAELAAMASRYPDTLTITIALSDEAPGTSIEEHPANIMFTTGFVHEAARKNELIADNSIAYIAGPPPMVDAALRDLLTEGGYEATQIRYDKFG